MTAEALQLLQRLSQGGAIGRYANRFVEVTPHGDRIGALPAGPVRELREAGLIDWAGKGTKESWAISVAGWKFNIARRQLTSAEAG